jgi:hypothetical protein
MIGSEVMPHKTVPAQYWPDERLLKAAALMQEALDLLDSVGETRSAVHLQHAIDVLGDTAHYPPHDEIICGNGRKSRP